MGRRPAVVDASVLIAFLASDDAHHEAATRAMQALLDPPIVPVVAYAEVMVGASASARSRRRTEAFFDTLQIEPLSRAIARRGAELRSRTGASLADALVVATAQEIDAVSIITADARWTRLDPRVQVLVQPGS